MDFSIHVHIGSWEAPTINFCPQLLFFTSWVTLSFIALLIIKSVPEAGKNVPVLLEHRNSLKYLEIKQTKSATILHSLQKWEVHGPWVWMGLWGQFLQGEELDLTDRDFNILLFGYGLFLELFFRKMQKILRNAWTGSWLGEWVYLIWDHKNNFLS